VSVMPGLRLRGARTSASMPFGTRRLDGYAGSDPRVSDRLRESKCTDIIRRSLWTSENAEAMKRLRATEIFTPGAFPSHTYVERSDKEYEARLKDALETTGQIISLSGPSKSGKTVLVERVVGSDSLITVTGAGVADPADVWERVLDWMDAPAETTRARTTEQGLSLGTEAKGKVGIPLVAQGEAGAKAEVQIGRYTAAGAVHRRRGMNQVIGEVANSDFVVLIDDFHYMPRAVQDEVAKQVKEAARQGVKIIIASVAHRSDDVVRANPELRGRVMAVDLDYWEAHNLRLIAEAGFRLLNGELNKASLDDFVTESAGSPQLMQAICLNACFELELRTTLDAWTQLTPTKDKRRGILERTAATTDFRSLVDVLDSGPKTRGTERKTYKFKDGTEGDVYRCILKAVAADPPRLSFPYDEILHRVHEICTIEEPVGSSITGSCLHLSKLALERFPKERVIDWDESKPVLDIPDPYLLFYLRWSGRLLEPER
jgi:hypothetical protein